MRDSSRDTPTSARRERGAITIWSALREDILTLRLAPGSALEEVSIARQFGLSRTPVREALFMLSGEGLVQLLPNRSSIVAPLRMQNLGAYFDTLVVLSRAVMIAAAQVCTPADADSQRTRLAAFRKAVEAAVLGEIVARQLEFLNGFATISQNVFLGRFYPDCLDWGRRTMLLHYFPFADRTELDRVADGYAALIDAVASRDCEACNRLVGEQMARVLQVVQASLAPRFADAVDMRTTASGADACAPQSARTAPAAFAATPSRTSTP